MVNSVDHHGNPTFNMNPMLIESIRLSDFFWDLIEVSVPNQEAEPHLLLVRGRAFATAGYLLSPEQQPIDGPALLLCPCKHPEEASSTQLLAS